MFIDGIGLSNFRSFGNTLQKIGPFSKVNLFIGQNNSGKSNILGFLTHYYPDINRLGSSQKPPLKFDSIDRHLGKNDGILKVSFAVSLQSEEYQTFLKGIRSKGSIEKILRSKTLCEGTDTAWFTYQLPWGTPIIIKAEYLSKDLISSIKAEDVLSGNQWNQIWQELREMSGGGLDQNWIPETLVHLSQLHFRNPKIDLIPAIWLPDRF